MRPERPHDRVMHQLTDEAEHSGAVLAAALARAESLAVALDKHDPGHIEGHRREIFYELSEAFYRGLGTTARAQIARYFGRP